MTLAASPAVTEAVLGAVPPVLPDMEEVLEEYFTLTRADQRKKSAAQYRRWQTFRRRAITNFNSASEQELGSAGRKLPIDRITREVALA